jgi:hypothetical protein
MLRHADPARVRRELRVLIGRQRRRIDQRLYAVGREGRRLLSWRTYLKRHPSWGLAVVAAGLIGAASLRRGRWPRQLDMTLLRRVGRLLLRRLAAVMEEETSQRAERPPHDRGEGACES